MDQTVLFVGNDINNINNAESWEELLQRIIEFCGIQNKINNIKSKPFPLLYEEIYLTSNKNDD